jgi:hypothetical protein
MFGTVAKAFKAERTLAYVKDAWLTRLAQKLRQLCDIYSNPSRFIFGEQLCCRSSPPALPRNKHRRAAARFGRERQSRHRCIPRQTAAAGSGEGVGRLLWTALVVL